MSHSISVTCPNEECEHEITLEVTIDPGEPAVWGLPENSYPGTGPSVELNEKEPVMCPNCGHWDEDQQKEFSNRVTKAVDDFDFSGAAQSDYCGPETQDDRENYED